MAARLESNRLVVRPEPPSIAPLKLTIGYVTSRIHCELKWFTDSLAPQVGPGDEIEIFVIDLNCPQRRDASFIVPCGTLVKMEIHPVKPNIWNGAHRIVKEQWWAVSNARNTALCLASHDYIVWVDDRCVLAGTWLQALRDAAANQYAVCGKYGKWHNMEVENGVIVKQGDFSSTDTRDDGTGVKNAMNQFWGGTLGCPTSWAFEQNGFEELVDSLSGEDYLFGMMLQNNRHIPKYDPRLKIIEDRTPAMAGTPMKRTDKGISPNDKSHAAIDRFGKATRADNFGVDLSLVRNDLRNGKPFPMVQEKDYFDWYDAALINEK